jgi:hypothetical protein
VDEAAGGVDVCFYDLGTGFVGGGALVVQVADGQFDVLRGGEVFWGVVVSGDGGYFFVIGSGEHEAFAVCVQ